jgi:hypothetical protein
MRGYTGLKQKRVLAGVFISVCLLITLAAGLGKPLASSLSPVSAFADNSAPVLTTFTSCDELNGAIGNSGYNYKQRTDWHSVACLSVATTSISCFDALFTRISNLNSIPAKHIQQAYHLLDIPPPFHSVS